MGVVRERKSKACSANQQSEDVDTVVNPPSSSESEDELILTIPVLRLKEQNTCLKRNTGKRKTRRYYNKRNLETLIKDDDYEDTLVEYRKTPFERLMEIEDDPLDFLNKFLLKLEEDDEGEGYIREKSNNPYMRISHKIRRTMKMRKNFPNSYNREVENDLIEFFNKKPFDLFTRLPLNSFERLFMHALAQYHDLNSKNYKENARILIEIRNYKETWMPVDRSLCDFLEHERL